MFWGLVSTEEEPAGAGREGLTAVTYVREQYISPRKKSRNSTGYRPANNKRHYGHISKRGLNG